MIVSGRTNLLSRMRVEMVLGFTPISTEKKAIRITLLIGTTAQGGLFAESRSMRNGKRSRTLCLSKVESNFPGIGHDS